MSKRPFKDRLYGEFARVGKALGSRRRLELLDVLAQGPRSVEDLAGETSMTVANASQHLQVLRAARMVEARQEGTRVYYRLADDRVFALWQALRDVARSRLAEVDQVVGEFLADRHRLEAVGIAELLERMRRDDVVVLDVRPALEYESGHIAGARSVPVEELEDRLSELSLETEIVAYCRGPYCVFADEAVERLRRHGHAARRLDVGYPDWKAAGLPVESDGEAHPETDGEADA